MKRNLNREKKKELQKGAQEMAEIWPLDFEYVSKRTTEEQEFLQLQSVRERRASTEEVKPYSKGQNKLPLHKSKVSHL